MKTRRKLMSHLAKIVTLCDEVRRYIPEEESTKPTSIHAIFRLHEARDELEKAVLLIREELEKHAEFTGTLRVMIDTYLDANRPKIDDVVDTSE